MLILIANAAALFVGAVTVLVVGTFLPLTPDGPIGLLALFSVHLVILALLTLPLVLVPDARALRIALIVLVVVAGLRFGDEWVSPPSSAPPAGSATLQVLTWNLEFDRQTAESANAFLAANPVDVVGLEELSVTVSGGLDDDPATTARYPFRALFPQAGAWGIGLLSRYPISDAVFQGDPSRLEAVVAAPGGPVRVIVTHPQHADIDQGAYGIPFGYDTSERTVALRSVRQTIDAALAGAQPVLVLGDINTAPTEPAFDRFTAGLTDVHRAVGQGPGWTYRSSRFAGLGIGLLRIDVVLMGPGLRPISEGQRCPPIGDHCAVVSTLVIR
jgi:vancomycin resistance protein VanJ